MASLLITESRLKQLTFEAIREELKEAKQNQEIHNRITSIVTETVNRLAEDAKKQSSMVNEAGDDAGMKRKAVMNMLKDGKYNHAELARKLWHPKDKSEEDTYRSLFSKKATGTPDSDGAVRHFDDNEINKLYELLRTR